MKFFLALLALSVTLNAEPKYSDEEIANAIYKAEGGRKTRHPYGILSVKVNSEAAARRVCLRTIRNNRRRWDQAGSPGEYLDFLADRYCPLQADPVGNRNWKRNVRALLASNQTR